MNLLGESSFFGLTGEDTINSLFLIILPKSEFVHSSLALEPLSEEWMEQPITDVITCLLMLVLKALENSGFCFSMVRVPCLNTDHVSFAYLIFLICDFRVRKISQRMLPS